MSRKDAVQINARVSDADAARFDALSSFLGSSKTETFLWLLDLVRYLKDDQLAWLVETGRERGVYPGRLLADLVGEALERRNAVAHGVQGLTKAERRRAFEELASTVDDLDFLK